MYISGNLPKEYELAGVVIILRHGDRGPLIPVANISSVNCGHKSYGTSTYKKYVNDILNASKTHSYINFVGPFMNYPLLPLPSRCSIGHLTPQGVAQHLQLGKILKELYFYDFKLFSYPWSVDDIVIYTTKYRRTFQSALAFLYAFLPKFDTSNVRMREARGINFCDDDCICEKISYYEQKHDQEKKEYRKSHPGVMELVKNLSPLVKSSESVNDITNPLVMIDALLTYACHGAKLPCNREKCIGFDNLSNLISYEEWESKQKRTSHQRKGVKLRAYGMLKNIINTLDAMMGDGKPKVAVYVGHDKTLNFILGSLGLSSHQPPHYASRIAIELYYNSSSENAGQEYRKNHHFRLVYNGKDLTKYIPFCNAKIIKQLYNGNAKRGSISLCNVAKLEKYIKPENYFKEYNATNFQDACIK